ncbi:hypothetical protein Patl1_07749 [Pistacia atlantica]|uniref:Uncharacterized protein n=1 Tax=Pistacia atlantica TaxID=434234 RepID=A0ACC1AEA9_9ROSI|nr:hypothetical protein Patl1_07749 [Pistacia atlantica]
MINTEVTTMLWNHRNVRTLTSGGLDNSIINQNVKVRSNLTSCMKDEEECRLKCSTDVKALTWSLINPTDLLLEQAQKMDVLRCGIYIGNT